VGNVIVLNSSTIADLLNLRKVIDGKRTEKHAVYHTLGTSVGTTSTAWLFTGGGPFKVAMSYGPFAALLLPIAMIAEKHDEWLKDRINEDWDLTEKQKENRLKRIDARLKKVEFARKIGAIGIMFLGNHVMRGGLNTPEMNEIMGAALSAAVSPAVAALAGLGVTTLLTSSTSASLLIQELARKGLMTMENVAPALSGANTATNFTGNFAAHGSGHAGAKRVAVVNLMSSAGAAFLIVGAMTISPIFGTMLANVMDQFSTEMAMQTAAFHTAFNAAAAAITIPFITPLLKGLHAVFPDKTKVSGAQK